MNDTSLNNCPAPANIEILLQKTREDLALAVTALQESEARLQDERLRLKNIIAGTRAGTWQWNIQTGETIFDEQWAEMIGYSLEELSPVSILTWQQFSHPDDLNRSNAALERHFRGESAYYECEARMRHKDGHWIWVLDKGKVASWTGDGTPLWMFGSHQDITGRKELEQRLMKSEQRFRDFMDNSPTYAWLKDDQGCYVFLNKTYEQRVGRCSSDYLGKTDYDLWPREIAEKFVENDRRVRESGTSVEVIEDAEDAFGNHYTWLNIKFPVQDGPNGCHVGAMGIDIGEIRRAEQEHQQVKDQLRFVENRFQLLVENSTDVIFLLDGQGVFRFISPAWEKLFGFSPSDMLNKYFAPMVHPDDAIACLDYLKTIMATREPATSPAFRVRHRNGEWRSFVANGCVYSDPSGTPLYLGIGRDISCQLAAEEELRCARETAEAANQAKSQFLANMSHEIRTPLNSIIGSAQILEHLNPTEEQKNFIEILRSASHDLLSLINDVLDLSRIESGAIELETGEFSLHRCIDDVIRTQAALIYHKRLRISTDIPAEAPDCLIGDQLRIKQIILNLLGNAIKFTSHGEIRIAASVSERCGSSALLELSVRDSGIGISPQALDKIFKPFTQADASTTRRYGGTGLGLAISTRLADLMGGAIRAESREGEGSTFFLRIPVGVTEVPAAHDQKQDKTVWDGPPLAILMVDDVDTNRIILSKLLKQYGFKVSQACSGTEALERCAAERFDVILMDIQMPGMSGIEAAHTIRSQKANRDSTIIIALTAHALKDERDHIAREGFDGYVSKPVEIETLFRELHRCLRERNMLPD